MAFGAVNIQPNDLRPQVGIGINLPFSEGTGFTSNYTTAEATRYNLINFFLTNPGERIGNPEFGGGLREFIFEQLSNDNITFLQSDIEQKIQQFFPNIIVTSLNIFENADFNSINIELKYEVANTNITDIINIEF